MYHGDAFGNSFSGYEKLTVLSTVAQTTKSKARPETRKGRFPGPFHPAGRPRSAHHNHARSDAHAIVKVDYVIVGHADAAGRHRLSDRLRLVRAMDAVER